MTVYTQDPLRNNKSLRIFQHGRKERTWDVSSRWRVRLVYMSGWVISTYLSHVYILLCLIICMKLIIRYSSILLCDLFLWVSRKNNVLNFRLLSHSHWWFVTFFPPTISCYRDQWVTSSLLFAIDAVDNLKHWIMFSNLPRSPMRCPPYRRWIWANKYYSRSCECIWVTNSFGWLNVGLAGRSLGNLGI